MARPMACPSLLPQKFQNPAPISGLTVLEVIWAQISVLPVNVILRPKASTTGAMTELNCCEKNMRIGRDKAPAKTARLIVLEASHPLLTIRKAPINVHNSAVLLWE